MAQEQLEIKQENVDYDFPILPLPLVLLQEGTEEIPTIKEEHTESDFREELDFTEFLEPKLEFDKNLCYQNFSVGNTVRRKKRQKPPA